jgi:hypothetical protein
MKYASYLETLTPEQKNTELENSARKSMKRTADKKALKQVKSWFFSEIELI